MKVVEWACLLLGGGASVSDPTPARAWGTAPPGQQLLPPALALVPSGWVSGGALQVFGVGSGVLQEGATPSDARWPLCPTLTPYTLSI